MKRFVTAVAAVGVAVLLVGLSGADDKPKGDDKKGGVVTALPPHPLDGAFEKAVTEKQLNEALLNDDLYKKAVKEALKAKQAQEKNYKDNPKFVGASPAQSARQAFLRVLLNEKEPAGGEKK